MDSDVWRADGVGGDSADAGSNWAIPPLVTDQTLAGRAPGGHEGLHCRRKCRLHLISSPGPDVREEIALH